MWRCDSCSCVNTPQSSTCWHCCRPKSIVKEQPEQRMHKHAGVLITEDEHRRIHEAQPNASS